MSLGKYFQQMFWMAAWQFSLHSSGSLWFVNTTISQGSVVTCLRCGGIFNYFITRNLLLSPLERILKIGQHFAKLEEKQSGFIFRTRCTLERMVKQKLKTFFFILWFLWSSVLPQLLWIQQIYFACETLLILLLRPTNWEKNDSALFVPKIVQFGLFSNVDSFG